MFSSSGCIQRKLYSTSLARIRKKHKVVIVLGFYGRKYGGMQTNDQKSSIEDYLISALYQSGKIEFCNVIKPSKFNWERCSRTDKGVSARQIVVSGKMMDYDDEFSLDMHNSRAVEQLNNVLPEDIQVFSYTRVSKRFNPHLNAYARQYLYYLPLDYYKKMGVTIDNTKFTSTMKQFIGTHNMKSYSGSIHHRNKDLKQFYLRTINSVNVKPFTQLESHYLEITLNGNSFLYHQIRKMIGASIAVACGSWTESYFQSAFTDVVQVPIAPSIPLCLDTVSFRNDKNVFLDSDELNQISKKGKLKENQNPNRKYDRLLLLGKPEKKKLELFFQQYTLPHILNDIQLDRKEMDDFVKHLHIGQCYDVRH